MRSLAVVAALALLSACGGPGSVEIVRDGKALAYVVLPKNAHPLEKEAAADLVWGVKEATGVALDVHAAPVAGDARMPIIIRSPIASPLTSERAVWINARYDTAFVHRGEGGLIIEGPTPQGAANGVATILMGDLGVRTYYPEPGFTVVPRADSVRVRERIAQPHFDYRLWSGLTGRDAAAYVRRNRLTDGRVPIPHYGFGHNLASFLNPSTLGAEHSDWFAFYKGKRQLRGKDVGDADQPCFTHPEVVQRAVEAARHFFDKNLGRDTFSLCVNDNPNYCECDRCAALDKPWRDIPVGRQHSESYFEFVSKVAGAIAQSHSGKYVGVYAYWNVEQPPRNRERLPDNVVVALTQDVLQYYDPAYRAKDEALVRAWTARTKHLHKYVYYGLGWLTPRTSVDLVAEDLRRSREMGVRAYYVEAYPYMAWSGPMLYVASRLQWDLNADVPALVEEFHRDCFGEASDEMKTFHAACERYWTKPRPGRWFEGLENFGAEEKMADPAAIREAKGHLEAALAKARDPKVRERIAWIKKGFDFTAAAGEMIDAKRSGAQLERLLAAAVAAEAAHAGLKGDPAYDHTYYTGDRFERKCWGWLQAPLRAAAETRRKELAGALPDGEAQATWSAFAADSGLVPFLDRRGWKF